MLGAEWTGSLFDRHTENLMGDMTCSFIWSREAIMTTCFWALYIAFDFEGDIVALFSLLED